MPLLPQYTCYRAYAKDDRGVWREYFGITRVDANQSAASAVMAREAWCRELPVGHFKNAVWDTLQYRPLGHMMTLDNALAEEALLTAEAMRDHRDFYVRGGPWHGAHLGYKGNLEAKHVARFGYRWRDDRRQARVEVRAYAATRADKSSLRRHIEGRPFVRDSAEPGRLESWAPERSPRGRSGPSGKSRSGNSKRGSKGLKYGSTTFTESKWGRKPVAARRKHRRKMTLKKRPSARLYMKRTMKVATWL